MKKLVLLWIVLASYAAFAQSSNPAIFKSVRASHDAALETNPASAFWQAAEPAFLNFDNMGNRVSTSPTEVRSRWTKDNLYLLFICPYRELNLKPNPDIKNETNQLWNWDVAEIFIGSDFKNIRHYKEFEISPQGEWIDLDVNLDQPHHENGWTWNSGFQVSARIDGEKKIWYGAMRIPFAAIDPHSAQSGTIFRVDMFRTEGAAPQKQFAWQPTMSDSFHVPERFGRLELVTHK